jgi:hypothetical protein
LHADKPLDGVEGGELLAAQQHLALQQRSVECAPAEYAL